MGMAKKGCDIIGENSVKNGGDLSEFIFDIDDTLYDQRIFLKGLPEDLWDGDELPIRTLFVHRSRVRSDEVFAMVEAGELPPEKMYAYRVCRR